MIDLVFVKGKSLGKLKFRYKGKSKLGLLGGEGISQGGFPSFVRILAATCRMGRPSVGDVRFICV